MKLDKEEKYWKRYAGRLTQEERREIASGGSTTLVRPRKPSWEVGEWLKVASNLDYRVDRVRERDDGTWVTSGLLRDFRVRLPRRVPNLYDEPEFDDDGNPKLPTAEAIEEARKEGGYTSSRAMAVPDIDEEPDALESKLERREREERAASTRGTMRIKQEIMAYEFELAGARRKGRKGRVRVLKKKVEQAEKRLDRAA